MRDGKVPELVEQCLHHKRQDGLKERYLVQLRSDLRRFASAFSVQVVSVTTGEIEKWLRSLKVGPRTRSNLRTSVTTFFSFCKRMGALPKHLPTEADSVTRIKVQEKEIQMFTPAQLRKLLDAAREDLVPFLAIGAVAGFRVSEIQSLDWSDIHFGPENERFIEVKSALAKTGARRLAPLSDNLAAWLAPLRSVGPVAPTGEMWRQATRLGRELGIVWPRNALRHSAISYRVALTGDVNRVALESGNTRGIIFKHYYQFVTRTAASQWFEIMSKKLVATG